MTYTPKNGKVDYVVFGLSVFLVFCLLFESYIELPILVAWIGRWHPLVLHFPIVLLLIAIFLGLTGRKIPRSLLTIAVISALLTAISGFFLGKETGSKGDLLFWHQWLGGALALLAALWYGLEGVQISKPIYSKIIQVVIVGLIIFTGHYGGMITHGQDFLALPQGKKQNIIPKNPLVYEHIVNRILEEKCVKCHNPNKKKGELLMTDLAGLLKGGEGGNTLIPGNPEESEMIRRLYLPIEDEEHMPPEGERPLADNEVRILEQWIALGASDTLQLNHLQNSHPLAVLIKEMMEPDPMEKWTALPKIADSTLRNLASDYLTITRLADATDALKVNVYMPPEYDAQMLLNLSPVNRNIVELDLSGLPIGERELAFAANCPNLEWLEIDRTPITDVEVDTLRNLSRLRLLKVYDTNIGDRSISFFKEWENLKSLYIWGTQVSESALEELKSKNPDVVIENGIDEEIESYFVASDSIPKS
ncbi:c-type cytochrome domain-containing protein [Ulvibacterium sp.]|uniref:c-type cytochrome domain-containing protein n=1 Tax=Ulvibacterium sp. TaxID=2665914 RepID=UPI0026288E8F|nr:c-type cytochrome domain-containing protein [Ulvibacterium sp.]